LLSKSTPYAGGTNSCLLNQPPCWWYIPTLEEQPYASGTDAAEPYSNNAHDTSIHIYKTINARFYKSNADFTNVQYGSTTPIKKATATSYTETRLRHE